MAIIQTLGTIPDVIWGAAIGSGLGFLGVLFTNLRESRRLQSQLKHDAEQRALERQMCLRREVYLKAAEAAAATFGLMGQLGNPNVTDREIEARSADIASSLGKVSIVASDATVRAVTAFQTEFGKSTVLLMGRRIRVIQRQAMLDSISQETSGLREEADRLMKLRTELLDDGRLDDSIESAIKRDLECARHGGNR